MRYLFAILIVALLVMFTGCTSYPLGMSKEQWEALSPEQQAENKAKQAKIDEERRLAFQAQRAEQLRLEEVRKREAREKIQSIYANPRPGDIIVVRIEGGEVGIGDQRRAYKPVEFELARGEGKWVDFVRQDKWTAFRQLAMHFSEDGRVFTFDADSRKKIMINNDGWQFGRSYHPQEVSEIQFGSGAKDVRIHIRYR